MSLPIICLSIYFMYLSISVYLLPIYPSIHPSMHECMYWCISVYSYIHLCAYVSIYLSFYLLIHVCLWVCMYLPGFLGGSDSKESNCNAGRPGFDPGLGRSPGREHGNPLQYTCLENPHGQRNLAGYSPWGRRVRHNWMTKLSTCIYPSTYLSAYLSVIYPCMYVCMYVCMYPSLYLSCNFIILETSTARKSFVLVLTSDVIGRW